jgi:hypothetical protein
VNVNKTALLSLGSLGVRVRISIFIVSVLAFGGACQKCFLFPLLKYSLSRRRIYITLKVANNSAGRPFLVEPLINNFKREFVFLPRNGFPHSFLFPMPSVALSSGGRRTGRPDLANFWAYERIFGILAIA